VSRCRQANAPLSVVEAIVGHSNPAMTRHYTHVGELAVAAALGALPSVMGGGDGAQALPAGGSAGSGPVALGSEIVGRRWRNGWTGRTGGRGRGDSQGRHPYPTGWRDDAQGRRADLTWR
jgi:hypothetical protein